MGSAIKSVNAFTAFQSASIMGAGQGADAILSQFETERELVTNVQTQFQGFAYAMQGWASTTTGVVDSVLSNLQAELNTASTSPGICLAALIQQMEADSQSVTPNVIATPTIAAAATNVGNGLLLTITASSLSGIADQRILNENLKVLCTNDQYNGTTAGGELFTITGEPTQPPYSYLVGGNGGSQNLSVADEGSNLLTNGLFDSTLTSGWTETVLLVPPSVAPTVSVGGSGGTWTAGNYFLKVTAVGTGGGETTAAPESAVFAITAGTVPTVTFPTQPAGLSAWNIYVTLVYGASGTETFQIAVTSPGSTYTITTPPVASATVPPVVNTAILNSASSINPLTTSTSAAYNATNGLNITGSSNIWESIELSQSLSVSSDTVYVASVMLRATTAPPAGSTLQISIDGVNLYSGAASAIPSTWTRYYVLVYPSRQVSTATLAIALTGVTGFTSGNIEISNIVVTEPVLYGSVGYAILRGTTDFNMNDFFEVVTANNHAGIFQTFFNTQYAQILPTSGSPTIADSLA